MRPSPWRAIWVSSNWKPEFCNNSASSPVFDATCLRAIERGAERAVLLAGAASALHEGSGNTPPRIWDNFMSPYLQPAREALGPDGARSAWEAGRRMDYEDALQMALSTVATYDSATRPTPSAAR